MTDQQWEYLTVYEYHQQHHLQNEEQDPLPSTGPKVVTVDATELDFLRGIRSRAETELQRTNEGSTDWYTLRYILNIVEGTDEKTDTALTL